MVPVVRGLVIAAALGVVLTVTGCASNPLQDVLDRGTEFVDGVTGKGQLPSGFPTDIPVVAGEIDNSVSVPIGEAQTWTVAITPSGTSPDSVVKSIADAFATAGFTSSTPDLSIAGQNAATYEKGTLTALVTVFSANDAVSKVVYVVTLSP